MEFYQTGEYNPPHTQIILETKEEDGNRWVGEHINCLQIKKNLKSWIHEWAEAIGAAVYYDTFLERPDSRDVPTVVGHFARDELCNWPIHLLTTAQVTTMFMKLQPLFSNPVLNLCLFSSSSQTTKQYNSTEKEKTKTKVAVFSLIGRGSSASILLHDPKYLLKNAACQRIETFWTSLITFISIDIFLSMEKKNLLN